MAEVGEPLQFPVTGIHCGGCAAAIASLLRADPAITHAEVSPGSQEATIRHNLAADTVWPTLAARLEAGGYGLRVRTATMTGSAEALEPLRAGLQAVAGVRGVQAADADTDAACLRVEHVDHPRVREAIARLGAAHGVGLRTSMASSLAAAEGLRGSSRWGPYLVAVLPLALVAALDAHGGIALGDPIRLALGIALQVGCGGPFLLGAIRAARRRRADMDSLIALGTLAAFGLSVAVILGVLPPPLHMHTLGMILAFVIFGRWLEERARRRTGDAVEALVALEPADALRRDDAGVFVRVPVAALHVGDHVRVPPGTRVPVDGRVHEGRSTLDESLVTGESEPVRREPGERVLAGALNGEGVLDIEVLAVGEDATLRKIAAWVRKARAAKAPVARFADRVAAWFVPAVLALAVLTAVAWALWGGEGGLREGIVAAVAVLVVACPCALGLATPLAIVVGVGRAARSGILFGNGAALERAAATEHVLFDKTGTLTHGRPAIRFAHTLGLSEALVMRFAAAVEAEVPHPLARAMVARAQELGGGEVPPAAAQAVEVVPGSGVRGLVTGKRVWVGTQAWLEEEGIETDAGQLMARRMEGHAATVIWVAIDGTLRGLFGATDGIREEAGEALARLRGRDISVGVLSGDRPAAVARVAMQLAIDDVGAAQKPDAKAQAVADRVASGTVIAFVGDGINDGPALAAADVGIAMHGATDVAAGAAEVALARPDLRLVPEALAQARTTLAGIRENLALAFVYNLVGLPLAALGVLPPAFAAAAMAASSLSVVLNSLRLRSRPLR